MNRPPTRRRPPRRVGFIWTGPYASWTINNTRRQNERRDCNLGDIIVAMCIAPYIPILALMISITISFSATPQSGFAAVMIPYFGNLTLGAVFILVYWYFWPSFVLPSLTRLGRNPIPSMTTPYPSPPSNFFSYLVTLVLLVILASAIAIFWPLRAPMIVLAFLAIFLILSGLRRRVGIDERCARCAYPVTTPRWSRGLCPECGRNLDARHAIILGHNTRSPARLAAGAVLTAAVFALAFVM